jgi:RNase P subunit RPR2
MRAEICDDCKKKLFYVASQTAVVRRRTTGRLEAGEIELPCDRCGQLWAVRLVALASRDP